MEAAEVRALLVLLDHAISERKSEDELSGLLVEALDAIDELAPRCGLLPRPRTVSGRNPTTVIVDGLDGELAGGQLSRKIIPPWDRDTVRGLNRWQANGYVHPFTCAQCRAVLIATKSGWACPVSDGHDRQGWAWAVMASGGPTS